MFFESWKQNGASSLISWCDSRDTPLFRKSTQTTRWSRGHATTFEGAHQRYSNAPQPCDIASVHIPQSAFTYDIILFALPHEKPVYRRLLLDFHGNLDAVSDDIAQLLNLPITPYYDEVRLPNGSVAKPTGVTEVKWQIYGGRHRHTAKLFVIPNSPFDMVLGVSSIRRCKLWKDDRDIRTGLKYNTNKRLV
ncbi:hypothetical protein ASPVEDRAFT_206959 [Aspergillus versicolor CBS 583.65]|uniref:Uncharacterized protein n=1 Tax=Aspergillus versicolor CBS 583.65 TaxID=1036611 RepID=A0A1L9P2V6_ASPVE|nr:uncharacterized protein ASPVEDRAFT_206959 [Aspergillus versicolor CBS 583.65]OJI95869.1 hypothetical protein ASPVEDRAFT_206959 [Aspergillus versicolor CBS 583.65]